ncbi:leucine-rich repeat-containing protein 40 [Drosophila obscura]|uniref:leucine-rich repeat-containing protein 40 n=1 Tax=Drosophila obscura TaxID=7282 RepID=UPI001BB1453C|nr:leucine-rich repeat-containing protein 40 [Drosophila obscura]
MPADGLNSPRVQGRRSGGDQKNGSPFPDKYDMRGTRALSICKSKITEVPMELFEQARLELVNVVQLEDNWLSDVPKDLDMLSELLTQLDLSKNQISCIPTNISQFSRLALLKVPCNLLRDLPMEFGGLQLLCELDISFNRFERLPRCIADLQSLETLLAHDNHIKDLDASEHGLGALKNLRVLDLSNNDIRQVPPILGNQRKIIRLNLMGNPLRQPRYSILSSGTEAIMAYLRTRIPLAQL